MPKSGSKQQFHYQGFSQPTTTPVPDDIFDIIAPELTEAELRVLLYIVRRTFGFKKDHDSISLTQMVKGIQTRDGKILDRGTGMSRQGVMNGTRGLQEKGIIEVKKMVSAEGDRDVNVYSLRFRKGVDNEIDHHSQRGLLGVGNKVDPQQTVLQQTDVVVINTLNKFKVGEEKAKEIADKYSPEHIAEKVEFLEWKLKTKARGRPIADPASWLIRAIEKDYKPPATFKPKAEREREAEQFAHKEAEREKQHQAIEAKEAEEKEKRLKELRRKYGTTESEVALWPQVLEEIKGSTTKATYQTWFPRTLLLAIRDGQAVIGVPNQAAREWLSSRLVKIVQRALESVVGGPIEPSFEVLELPQDVLEQ